MTKSVFCAVCNKEITDVVLKCPSCGGTKFSSFMTDNAKFSEPESNITIQMHARGLFSINLEELTKRQDKNDPITIKDQKGKVRILFNPDI